MVQIQSSAPPEPVNPFPRKSNNSSWAGITDDAWLEVHDEFRDKFPEFVVDKEDDNGHPGKILTPYHEMWEKVEGVLRDIGTSAEEGRRHFRDWITGIVDKAGHVDSAVSLATGVFTDCDQKTEEAFVHQLAVFITIRNRLQMKQKTTIPMVFQDPRFGIGEEYLLSSLAGGKVVEHPGCLKHMTKSSFVFAIHLPASAFVDTIFPSLPALYIGNKIQNTYSGTGQVLAARYIRQVYMSGHRELTKELREIIDRTASFDDYYDLIEFDGTYDRIHPSQRKRWFQNTFVHFPKLKHPELVSSNKDRSEADSSNSDPNRESYGGPEDAHGGPPLGDVRTASAAESASVTLSAMTLAPAQSESAYNPIQSVGTEPIAASARQYLADNSLWDRGKSSATSTTSTASEIPASSSKQRQEQDRKRRLERQQSPENFNPDLDPRNFPIRNKTDKVAGIWKPNAE
ncbi:hypothetical protein E4T42_06871 [Aureobasidium subglaciale]|nr:hypothetical protein E4T42_06871 [Aureobasidium subglaciale]